MQATGEQVVLRTQARPLLPGGDGVPSVLGDLELDRLLGLSLEDHRSTDDAPSLDNVAHTDRHQITAS